MIKKVFVLFLCVFLSGCCKKNNDVVIKFSTWGSASEMSILKPIVHDFEKQNPHVHVELIHIPQDYFQKLHLLFASNLAPDVIFINNINLPVYADFLEDLTTYIKNDEFFHKSTEALSYKGKVLAVPRDVSTLVIYYNKTLFRKYGVPYPDENWTIEDLLKKSTAFKSHNIYGISYEPQIYYALPYMYYFKGGILDGAYKNISGMPESVKGITFYKNLAYEYHCAPAPAQTGSKTLAQMFLEGKIAMHLSGRWLVPKYRESAKFDWDIVNFPRYSVPCDASGWAVSKSSKHKDIALKVVLFLASKKNIEKMSQDGLIVPARIDAANSLDFQTGKPEHSNLFIKSAIYSRKAVISKDYTGLTDKLNDKIFNSGY